MSTKSILSYTLLFSLLILISAKEENQDKFLSFFGKKYPVSLIQPPPEVHSFSSNGTSGKEPKLINIKCLYSKGYNIYSLQPLQKKEDYRIEEGYNGNPIIFNFCKNTKAVNNATFVEEVNGTYVRLAGSIDGEGNNKNTWNENDDGGVIITFNEGDQCNEDSKHVVKLTILCDSDVEGKDFLKNFTFDYSDDPCIHTMTMRSIHGCTLRSTYLLLKLLNKYNYVFCVIFVLVGLVLCLFGNRYINKTIIIIGGFIGCYAITAAVLSFFPSFITTETYLFVCLFVAFVLGCVIGYFLKDDIRFSCLLLGAALGFSCATFVYQIVQNYVEFDPEIVYYACIGVCIVLGAFLGWKLHKYVVIIGTAVLGGYLVMRGISLVAKNYLDESLVIDLIKNKEWDELKDMRNEWIYAYLGTWAILTVVGIYYQCKNNGKKKTNKDIKEKKK